jgi:hypothetical protein
LILTKINSLLSTYRGTYTLNGYYALNLTGSSSSPIVVKGAGAGKTIINQQSTAQNIVNVVGRYFSFYNMTFTGGSRGVRLGPGTCPPPLLPS